MSDKQYSVDNVRLLEFAQHGDERGHLVVIEGDEHVPYEIKRVFYIYGTDAETVRGRHANRRSTFVLISIAGRSKVLVRDARGAEREFVLDRPNIGLYIPPMIWKDMYDFSPGAVMLVLASEHYDPEEYIRNFQQFSALHSKLTETERKKLK